MIKFNVEVKLPDILRLRNTNRYLVEGWIFGNSRIKKIFISIGDKCYKAEHIEILRPDVRDYYFHEDPSGFSLFSGFSVPVIIYPVLDYEEREIVLNAEFKNGEKFTYGLGILKLESWKKQSREFSLPLGVTDDELLVICMATYNPKISRFIRQVESIIKQDYKNWICIVSDDCSDESCKKYMRDIIAKDPRFYFIEHTENVGFYHNFERCLELVPSIAKYVALSDQDDYWYPNKLSECLCKLVGKTQLVYCDMRIVHENGKVMSETYWKNRKNYYKSEDIDILVIVNTVTGAASVFRTSLLEKILPFPPRYGNVFHDQWIAIIAAASGGIEYVNKPLYDYIQSNENVIGHCDFGPTSVKDFIISYSYKSYQLNAKNLSSLKRIKLLIYRIQFILKNLYYFMHIHGKHISTLSQTASLRNLNSYSIALIRRPMNVLGLLKMRAKIVSRKETTCNTELSLLFSRIINFLYPLCISILGRIMLHRRGGRPAKKFMEILNNSEK